MALSIAQEAKRCDPWGCELPKDLAEIHWKTSNFIDSHGNCHIAYGVKITSGILSVTFADGSILCMDHWKQ
jgi:hypothetical protein